MHHILILSTQKKNWYCILTLIVTISQLALQATRPYYVMYAASAKLISHDRRH